MARKCCRYERNGEVMYACTTDANCPNFAGWTLVGSYGVGDCTECRNTDDGDGDEIPEIPRFEGLSPKDIEKLVYLAHWIKEHWDEVFPKGPDLKEFEKWVKEFDVRRPRT